MFSPALFHVNMSLMLALLMLLNAVAGVLVLPSFIAWSKADFITRYLAAPGRLAPGSRAGLGARRRGVRAGRSRRDN